MSISQLPPVAKSFLTDCKKCSAERYHRVLAHTSTTSAKVQCEVCGAKATYKVPSEIPKSGKAKTIKANTMGRNGSAKREANRARTHIAEYESLCESGLNGQAYSYNMKSKFDLNQKLDHPKFGIGFIRSVLSDKIEVIFKDEVRTLIHNKI